ncbi:hypothetical protein [Pontibacter arcticus]|uniref:Uncharacterized protein n=1 Tax=Pontibacter arcticus TaxID=2080288 RepID=A0A364RGK3_9BACT|nr:hypothetical protein [Pontibacter arcticus]RAU83387.1 hypothetical protein DP923_09300 [Pontibacter arcticus]
MEELKSLARLIEFSKNYKTVLPHDLTAETKEGYFLENLRNDKYANDDEAANDLYQSDTNDIRYKMLKHRLKKKLYNNLVLINLQQIKLRFFSQKEIECYTSLQQAQVLLKLAEYKLAANLANKIITISNQFEFTNLLIACYELLLFCYAEQGDVKAFVKYKQLLSIELEKKRHEREAVNIYQFIKAKTKKSIKSRKEVLPTLPDAVDDLKRLWLLSGTFDAFNAYYKGSMIYHELEGDFSKILELTLLSEKWVSEGKINAERFESLYNKFILIYAHLRVKEYASGLIYANKFVSEFEAGTRNWFAYMENYFLLASHSKNYSMAESIVKDVTANPSYHKLAPASVERWLLYSAYLSLVTLNETFAARMKEYLFVSLPEYSKDKQGFNVAILILQFVYFLQKGDSEALIYRIDGLKKYILFHLKDSFSQRSKLFIKLLILAVTENLNAKACRTKGQRLYLKLQETPTPGDAYAEIEIVPYEHLWEVILASLETKKT